MLGKLLKYEWKSMRKLLSLIYLAVLVLALCVGISLRKSILVEVSNGSLIFLAIYMILITAMAVVTLIVILERFYRSLISQEGYLMHTLPVSPCQHILSKLIMAVIWVAIAAAVILLSVVLIGGVSGIFSELAVRDALICVVRETKAELGTAYISVMMICTFVQLLRMIVQFYLAMAIGGAMLKNKVLWSFVSYVVLVVLVSVVDSLFGITMLSKTVGTADGLISLVLDGSDYMVDAGFNALFGGQIIIDLILLIVFFILTNYFLKKRLNLE